MLTLSHQKSVCSNLEELSFIFIHVYYLLCKTAQDRAGMTHSGFVDGSRIESCSGCNSVLFFTRRVFAVASDCFDKVYSMRCIVMFACIDLKFKGAATRVGRQRPKGRSFSGAPLLAAVAPDSMRVAVHVCVSGPNDASPGAGAENMGYSLSFARIAGHRHQHTLR